VPERSGRSGKANNHNPDMYALEDSDCAVVPVKRPNKEASAPAEVVEGRAQTIVVLRRFRDHLCALWRAVLRRRSQRRRPGWDRLRPAFDRWIPLVRICAGGGQR
jgi:hypothetical protein